MSKKGFRDEFVGEVSERLTQRISPDLWELSWPLMQQRQRREIMVGLMDPARWPGYAIDTGGRAAILTEPPLPHRLRDSPRRAPRLRRSPKEFPEVLTILLTDDDSSVRAPLRRILEDSGFLVVEAGGGEEALSLANGLDGPIHLLLTDVVMPGISGGELARRLGESRPRMKILFMSGYSSEAIASHGTLLPGAGFLAKPFSASDLVTRVRETLAAPPLLPQGRSSPSTGQRSHGRK